MNIKQLIIGLENWETIYVPAENVVTLEINDVKEDIVRYNSNFISRIRKSDEIYVEIINPDSFKISTLMYDEKKETPTCLERVLKYPDITSVTIEYDNNTEENISVLWANQEECNNSYQKAQVSKEGNLHILISERGLKEYLDKDREGYYDYKMNENTNMDF